MVRPYSGTSAPVVPPEVDVERVATETSVSSTCVNDANSPNIVTLAPNAAATRILATASESRKHSDRSKVTVSSESNQVCILDDCQL